LSDSDVYLFKSQRQYVIKSGPKVHKKGILFRIIVLSSVNFTCYSFANYLHKILHKSLLLPKSHVKNSFQLHKILQDLKIPRNHVLISLNVKSLFTNIPVELVIEEINRRWEYIEKETKIFKIEFIDAVRFVLNSIFFTFDNIIYKQIFGTRWVLPYGLF